MLFTVMGWKLKYSAQESDLAPFVGNGNKDKTSSEIKLPLLTTRAVYYGQIIDFLLKCYHYKVNPKMSTPLNQSISRKT